MVEAGSLGEVTRHATVEPTATSVVAPTPVPVATVRAPAATTAVEVPAVGDARSQFIAGYRDAGGPEALLSHFLEVVIACESTWRVDAVSPGGHLGLAQFAPDSWAKAGGGDWTDAYQQGANTARWVGLTNPADQWSCW